MATKIIVDSASDITINEAKQLGIELIPIEVRFGDEEYLDGVNITHSEFYEKLALSQEPPQTSQINPFRFEEELEKSTRNGDDVILITMSSKLSGTYRNALLAADKFNGKVHVVDSLNATIGQRLLALYALKLAAQNIPAKTIANILEDAKKRLKVIAAIDTLEYLKKGGRISATSAMIGTMLSIKPLIQVIDGEVKVVGKALGTKKKYAMLTQLINNTNGIDYDMPLCFVFSGSTQGLEEYINQIPEIVNKAASPIVSYSLGCTIGTHIGPGAIGISFFEK